MSSPSFGFVGEDYSDYSLRVGVEETRNLYPHIVLSPTARKRIVLHNVPGHTQANRIGTSVRDLFYQDGRCFGLSNLGLHELFSDGTSVLLGATANDGAKGQIVSNGRQGHQVIVRSAGKAYVYDTIAATVTQITDVNFPASCRAIEFIEGYLVYLDNDTGQMGVSSLFDAMTYDGTQVAIRSQTSDKVIDIRELDDMWVFGTQTIDVWRHTGRGLFPFDPIEGSRIKRGLRAPATVVRIAGGFAFLGDGENGGVAVYKTEGYNAIRISTPAIDHRLGIYRYVPAAGGLTQQIAIIHDAEAYGYEEAGHVFYVLCLPKLKTCYVYDFTTQLWHERNRWVQGEVIDPGEARWEAHPGICHAWCFDQHWIGDRSDGRVYFQSLDQYDFGFYQRRWLRRAPHIGDGWRSTFHHRLQIDMETGLAAGFGTGSDPQAMMRYSDDFGKTWSNERWASMGLRGDYGVSVEWRRLGMARGGRVYEVSGTAGFRTVIADAYIDAREGIF